MPPSGGRPGGSMRTRASTRRTPSTKTTSRTAGRLRLSAGAEFVVVIAGDIMTMPGLPRLPAANTIGLNEMGQVEGLF